MTEKDEGKRLQLSLDKLGDWEKEMESSGKRSRDL